MGFASGFQVGQQAVERGIKLREEDQERKRIREAMGLTPQEMQQRQATPEEFARAQAETQALAAKDAQEFGLTPSSPNFRMEDVPAGVSYAPQMPVEGQMRTAQYGLGGQTFSRMPTQQEIESARYAAAANVIAERDPMAAMRMRQEQVRMQREAEEAPLRLEALRTQVESGKIGLKKSGFELTAAERAAADAKRTDDFNEWRSQNPQADFATMTAKAQELGMSVDQQFKIVSNLTGIKEQAFKAAQQRIQELVQNQGLDGLLKAHKESKDLDPNSHFEVIRGQGGKVSLNRVNTATGEIIQPNVFSGSEAETTAYLNKAAMNPATIIDYTMTLEKNKLAMDKDRAATRAYDRSGVRAPDINEYVDAKGNVRLIDVGALPRDTNKQPIMPPGLRKIPTGSAATKDLTPQQQRAFDALKGTDAFKNAVERGDQPAIRKLLTDNAIPPEAFYGSTAAPPGGGDWTAAPPPAEKPDAEKPAPAAASGLRTAPSPAAVRALRERAIGMFTSGDVVDAAAAAGNPQAIAEQQSRAASLARANEQQLRGLGM